MFTIAHLSDPHLAPLPPVRWSELVGKRVTGYINWQRRRRFIHDPGTLAAIVADLRKQVSDDPRIHPWHRDELYLCTRRTRLRLDTSKALLLMHERTVKYLFVPVIRRGTRRSS